MASLLRHFSCSIKRSSSYPIHRFAPILVPKIVKRPSCDAVQLQLQAPSPAHEIPSAAKFEWWKRALGTIHRLGRIQIPLWILLSSIPAVLGWYAYEATKLKSEIHSAISRVDAHRDAYIGGHTPRAAQLAAEADIHMRRMMELMRAKPLSTWITPALWYCGLDVSSVHHLCANVHFHRAVMELHQRDFKTAISLLSESSTARRTAGDTHTWHEVVAPTTCYVLAKDIRNTFFGAQADINLGKLCFSLGDDEAACKLFNHAKQLCDELVLIMQNEINRVRENGSARNQLKQLGSHVELTSVDDSVRDLLTKCGPIGIVEAQQVPDEWMPVYMEAVERLKLAWRTRATVRCNLIYAHIFSASPNVWEVQFALQELCNQSASAPSGIPVMNSAYTAVDYNWLTKGGTMRICTAIAAALTEFRWRRTLDKETDARVQQLAAKAFDLANRTSLHTSAYHQGMLQYHHARHLLLEKRVNQFLVEALLNQALRNFEGPHTSQRDLRISVETVLLQSAIEKSPSTSLEGWWVRRLLRELPTNVTKAGVTHPLEFRLANKIHLQAAKSAYMGPVFVDDRLLLDVEAVLNELQTAINPATVTTEQSVSKSSSVYARDEV